MRRREFIKAVAGLPGLFPLAVAAQLPAIYPLRIFAIDGGLISYGPDTADQFRRADRQFEVIRGRAGKSLFA